MRTSERGHGGSRAQAMGQPVVLNAETASNRNVPRWRRRGGRRADSHAGGLERPIVVARGQRSHPCRIGRQHARGRHGSPWDSLDRGEVRDGTLRSPPSMACLMFTRSPRCQIVPLPGNQVAIGIDGHERLRWHAGKDAPRPFLFPLIGPSGLPLTRMGHPGAPNHDHHRSVWFAHHKVLGIDFWSDQTEAVIRQQGWLAYEDGNEEARMAVELHWFDGHDPQPLIAQQVIFAITPGESRDGSQHAELTLEIQTSMTSFADSLELGQTNFGLLAVRMAKSLSAVFGMASSRAPTDNKRKPSCSENRRRGSTTAVRSMSESPRASRTSIMPATPRSRANGTCATMAGWALRSAETHRSCCGASDRRRGVTCCMPMRAESITIRRKPWREHSMPNHPCRSERTPNPIITPASCVQHQRRKRHERSARPSPVFEEWTHGRSVGCRPSANAGPGDVGAGRKESFRERQSCAWSDGGQWTRGGNRARHDRRRQRGDRLRL